MKSKEAVAKDSSCVVGGGKERRAICCVDKLFMRTDESSRKDRNNNNVRGNKNTKDRSVRLSYETGSHLGGIDNRDQRRVEWCQEKLLP